ncbi:hypothetical protein AJ80_00590 [Polytolypa hystricis UAMH7299]|uniref:Major facilitator superfamily (MFS) profile domain-containing protein n=1 Tax=Polytolypa hystricis (strain UAMH7299) TaxID=1447883 RepID=A0A2B7Z415_POLH7|nr:hypothetical protein AJ80_00590 [Polytolypa hystricis UAMH7299]
MEKHNPNGLRANWKAVTACVLMSFCPFQYGLDFGLIGGLQAMIGFLKNTRAAKIGTCFRYSGTLHRKRHGGWNFSPVRQQLISSLMILGAFISSAATGIMATARLIIDCHVNEHQAPSPRFWEERPAHL